MSLYRTPTERPILVDVNVKVWRHAWVDMSVIHPPVLAVDDNGDSSVIARSHIERWSAFGRPGRGEFGQSIDPRLDDPLSGRAW